MTRYSRFDFDRHWETDAIVPPEGCTERAILRLRLWHDFAHFTNAYARPTTLAVYQFGLCDANWTGLPAKDLPRFVVRESIWKRDNASEPTAYRVAPVAAREFMNLLSQANAIPIPVEWENWDSMSMTVDSVMQGFDFFSPDSPAQVVRLQWSDRAKWKSIHDWFESVRVLLEQYLGAVK